MGRRKKTETEATTATTEAASQNGTPEIKTKADAVRAALAQGIESPKAISEFLKTTYGMEMSSAMASTYKANEANKEKKKPASAPKAKKLATTPFHGGTIIDNGLVASMTTIKALVGQLGAAQVKQLADLFG